MKTPFYYGSTPVGYIHKYLLLLLIFFITNSFDAHNTSWVMNGEVNQCPTKLHNLRPDPQLELNIDSI
jgi:hypothetical protein